MVQRKTEPEIKNKHFFNQQLPIIDAMVRGWNEHIVSLFTCDLIFLQEN